MEKQKINFDFYLKRFIVMFLLYMGVSFIMNPELETSYSILYMFFSIIIYCFMFLILVKIKNDLVIESMMLISMVVTFPAVSFLKNDFFLSLGLCLISMMIIFFFIKSRFAFNVSNKFLVISLILIMSVYVILIGYSCYCSYKSYKSQTFDFGIWCQMFYYMKKTGLQLVTCERNTILNHLAVHFSPIYYLLLPFVFITNVQCTLIFAHSIIAISGIVALVFIMRHYNLSNREKLLICILYALFPALTYSSYFFIHEYVFLTPLILWLIYFIIKDNNKMILLFTLLVLMVKEDAFIYAICIHLYFMIVNRRYKKGLIFIVFSVLYSTMVIACMKIFGEGVMTSRYDNLIKGDGGIIELLNVFITNPMFVITELFSEKKFEFVIQMFMPLLFIPVITKDFKRYILLIPFVLIHLITGYDYQYDIFFQYVYGSIGIIFFLFIINYIDLKESKTQILLGSLMATLIFCANLINPFDSIKDYTSNKAIYDSIEYSMNAIPSDAVILCSSDFLSNISQRDEIYLIDDNEIEDAKYDYIVVDLRYEDKKYYKELSNKEDYEMLLFDEDLIAIFKKI